MMENLNIIKGLYAVTPEEKDSSVLSSQVESCIKGGARLIQYRAKTLSKIEHKEQARKVKIVCDFYKVPLIINDDIELCRILDADGVHLGEDDDSLEKARLILGPSKIIGSSCYNSIERVIKAVDKGATYIALGACFPTTTKPNAPRAPLDFIALVLKEFKIPVVAIGGINLENIELLINEGVNCVALINNLFKAKDIEGTARQFSSLININEEL
ncbi:thiamine phosphate synthase [Methylophilaceae bacterium]|nr:thiamine phosphate synthase [Methylophilaceae bacterium]